MAHGVGMLWNGIKRKRYSIESHCINKKNFEICKKLRWSKKWYATCIFSNMPNNMPFLVVYIELHRTV